MRQSGFHAELFVGCAIKIIAQTAVAMRVEYIRNFCPFDGITATGTIG